MAQTVLITVDEVKERLNISKSKAYKVVQDLNKEMKAKGYYTISGRVSEKYFCEHFYGM